MADTEVKTAEIHLRKLKPGPQSQEQLRAIARLHRELLPHTTSSRAGLAAVQCLYEALMNTDSAEVIWSDEAGFLSYSLDLRKTERFLKGFVPLSIKIPLAFTNLLAPFHILSRLKWESIIPHSGIAYILTVGSRTGRGRKLLEICYNQCIKQGIKEIWVDTEMKNQRAVEFYLKNGFQKVTTTYGQTLLKRLIYP